MSQPPSSDARLLYRPFDVARWNDDASEVRILATEAECAALAEADGLLGIEHLEAKLTVLRRDRSRLHVTGEVRARIRQTCVVTLEPFDSDVVEAVDVDFVPQAEWEAIVASRRSAADPEAIEEDLPDPIIGNRIDLGGLAAEFLALGLDPYPKKPGAVFAEPVPDEEKPVVSPFAALSRLRPDRS